MYHNEAVLWRKSREDGWTRPESDTTPPRFRGWQKIEKEPMWVPSRAVLTQYEVQNFSGSFDGTVRRPSVKCDHVTHSYYKKMTDIRKHTRTLYDENSDTNRYEQGHLHAG